MYKFFKNKSVLLKNSLVIII